MRKYKIEITEVLQKQIIIEAENIDKAILEAKELYQNQSVVLDDKDYIETKFEVI